ncbi:hypothetical protein ABPG77_010055 [Micractinium sp. CCAP 211/92]
MIAVHAGAGYHSPALEAAYKRDLATACRAGVAVLEAGGDALEAVAAAIRVLEASPHCNAGDGSNLSFGGVVECDASVMAGDGAFGAVAAAPGIQHPVEAAALLAQEGKQPLSHGRVRPMMLAGDRAREWALSRGLAAAASRADAAVMHLTDRSQRQWHKYRRIVDGRDDSPVDGASTPGSPGGSRAAHCGQLAGGQQAEQQGPPRQQQPSAGPPLKRSRTQSSHRAVDDQGQQPVGQAVRAPAADKCADCLYDTVGCVALAPGGGVAAGVSSGGIVLKMEGRVGEAAVYGAGCWAQQPGSSSGSPAAAASPKDVPAAAGRQGDQPPAGASLACSVTGVGERVMQHLLARELCRAASGAGSAGPAGIAGAPEGQEPAEPALDEVAAALLRRTILLGPAPHDCGLLCLRAQPLGSSGGGSSGGGGSPTGCQTGSRAGRAGQPPHQQRVAVEVAVAHSAQSMAFAHMACPAQPPASTGNGAHASSSKAATGSAPPPVPAVRILRRSNGSTDQTAEPVQTYLHGITLHV